MSLNITVLNAIINHSDDYFLPALDNIRPATPIMEDRQLLDLSQGVNNNMLLSPNSTNFIKIEVKRLKIESESELANPRADLHEGPNIEV